MKKRIIYLSLIAFLGSSFTSNAIEEKSKTTTEMANHDHKKTEEFKVYGNCGMCKRTIESSLKNEKGIESAIWNIDTKMMKVTFHEDKISLKEIKEKIASVGYDTDAVKSSEKTYNALPGCCQYDRP